MKLDANGHPIPETAQSTTEQSAQGASSEAAAETQTTPHLLPGQTAAAPSADVATTAQQAVAQENLRWESVKRSPEYQGREDLAHSLLGNPGLTGQSAEQICEILAKSPAPTAPESDAASETTPESADNADGKPAAGQPGGEGQTQHTLETAMKTAGAPEVGASETPKSGADAALDSDVAEILAGDKAFNVGLNDAAQYQTKVPITEQTDGYMTEGRTIINEPNAVPGAERCILTGDAI